MLGALPGQVNESHGVGGGSRGWLAINLSLLALYRQVRRRRAFKWTQKFPAGALAIGGFGRCRWRLRRSPMAFRCNFFGRGKESNSLEELESETIHSAQEV